MATPDAKPRAFPLRPLIVVGVLLAAGVAAGGYVIRTRAPPQAAARPLGEAVADSRPQANDRPAVAAQAPAASAAAAPALASLPVVAPAATPAVPNFDVVRVSPQGNAVIAGRAEPGADVVVFDGAREVARTRADRRGEFVALPAAPLPEGGRTLTLASRSGQAPEVRSDSTVVVVVPPKPASPAVASSPGASAPVATDPAPVAMAVLVPSAAPARVLDAPRPAGAGLSLDVVDYDDAGAIRFSGAAALGAAMRVYVDNLAVGDAVADQAGRWTLVPRSAVAPGVHSVRVDHIDAGGRVMARVELPFQRAAVATAEAVAEVASGKVVVQPGQNLWRLARSAYGSGVRYTVIYQANKEQIRNPRLIYPGQVFATPAAAR